MKYQKGQALVLVLLSLAVVLTLVLFILSRSVTDILVSSKGEEAARAFSAAEAGIEQSLVIGTSGSNNQLGNNAGYVSSVAEFPAVNSSDFNYPIELFSGDSMTTWFVSHEASTSGNLLCDGTHPCFTGNTIKVCWGKPGNYLDASKMPAIEFSVFYESTPGVVATTKIARATFDPNAGRTVTNGYAPVDAGNCTISGTSYQFQKTIQFSALGVPAGSYDTVNGLQFSKVRMFYNTDMSHPVGINVNFPGNSTLPTQGQNIVSTGTAGTSARRINVFQGWPEVPSVFDNVIYSSTGITK